MYIYICIYIYIYTYVYVYVYTCVYIYIYMYMLVHMHALVCISSPGPFWATNVSISPGERASPGSLPGPSGMRSSAPYTYYILIIGSAYLLSFSHHESYSERLHLSYRCL